MCLSYSGPILGDVWVKAPDLPLVFVKLLNRLKYILIKAGLVCGFRAASRGGPAGAVWPGAAMPYLAGHFINEQTEAQPALGAHRV